MCVLYLLITEYADTTAQVVGVIGAPTSAGAYAPGQERAPAALRQAGLLHQLRGTGITVIDHGDIPGWRWRPDPARPYAQNLEAVVEGARAVEASVRAARSADEFVLVLGGDCTVELGTVAGHLPQDGRIGLIYFDVHPDLNVPSSERDGALDWMGLAHMLGEELAADELTGFGPRRPLLDNDQVVLFAQDRDQTRPWELQVIERRSLQSIPLEEVAAYPEVAAERALALGTDRWEHILVHLDVDTIDFTDAPLSENTGRNVGLPLETAFRALGGLLQDPRVSALTITELNPDHGESDGSTLKRFVDGLVGCVAGAVRITLAGGETVPMRAD
jgi:arginase